MELAATSIAKHSADGSFISGTNIAFARINAFMATALARLREDGKDSIERHRQKVHEEPNRFYFL